VIRTPIKLGRALAAAALAAGLAVTACGTTQLGAAAIIGGQRISATALAAQVKNLQAGYRKYRPDVQLQFPVSEMPQEVLGWIVKFRVRDALAARKHIVVTTAEVQQELATLTKEIKESDNGAPLAEAGVSAGLPPDLLRDLGRYEVIETLLLNRFDGGKLPTASSKLDALEARVNTADCLASKSLDIKINPQFGALDYSEFTIVSPQSKLSAATAPSPSPTGTAAPQLTPHC
jgi:SurA N-terminal domain